MDEEKKQVPTQRYPYYNLKQCVEYIDKLYSIDKLAEVPKDTAMEHMGLDPKNDFSARATASLTGFSLIEEKGTKNRTMRLTQLGRAIVLTKDETRKKAIKEAALNYEIIKALYNKWNEGLPSDEVIKLEVVNRGFTERAAGRFVTVFRESYEFAQLGSMDIPSGGKDATGDKKEANESGKVTEENIMAAKMKLLKSEGYEEYTLSLSKNKEIKLFTSDTLTEGDLEFMLLWIQRLDLARKVDGYGSGKETKEND